MQWVETTGRSIEAAKEAALDELGVDESDAEFELVEEPRAGLFGRVRGEARVRARVRPTAPRPKDDRRSRKRRSRSGPGTENGRPEGADAGEDAVLTSVATSNAGSGAAIGAGRPLRARHREHNGSRQGEGDHVEVALEEQGRVAQQFLAELASEFGVEATITVAQGDDTVDVRLDGSELGLLIGPKGSTLLAIQDLTRAVVHHRTGAGNGRIHVDVGGYRQRRAEALGRFADQVARQVLRTGAPTALEPMSAADRKVVHDAVTEIDGVSTTSEGDEPHRRVVILPSATSAPSAPSAPSAG